MIKIISFKICPFVQRVTALLEAKNIAYELEYISLKDKPKWFLELSPTGQVPVLVTDSGKALFESEAIVEYIDETSPPIELGLSAEQKALDRAWSYQASKHYLVQCSAQRSDNQETLIERSQKLEKAFAKAENVLGAGPYFKGQTLSNVDIAWLPLLHRANIINKHTCYDFLDGYPKVKTWQQAIMKTGLTEKSVEKDFEEAFTDFYLSEQTFLGGNQINKGLADQKCANGTCC